LKNSQSKLCSQYNIVFWLDDLGIEIWNSYIKCENRAAFLAPREVANINFKVFGLTKPDIEPRVSHMWSQHANYYTTGEVHLYRVHVHKLKVNLYTLHDFVWLCIQNIFIYYSYILVRCTQYKIMWSSLSVTCDRSLVFSGYSGFLHQSNWLPQYNLNIVESGVNHHKPTILVYIDLVLKEN
jgi:hypothetical protein